MTPIQAKMLAALRDHTVDGVTPNYAELAQLMGWKSRSSVVRVLYCLRDEGKIAWDPSRKRSLRILSDGPARTAMTRWSDAEVSRVMIDCADILAARKRADAHLATMEGAAA